MVAMSVVSSCFDHLGPEVGGGVVDLGDVGGVNGVFKGGEVEAGRAAMKVAMGWR